MHGPYVLAGAYGHFPLGARKTIGRSSDCDIAIRDRSVSRLHAKIELAGEIVTVHDLDSRNGTFVNSLRIRSAELPLQGVVQFGAVAFQLIRGELLPPD